MTHTPPDTEATRTAEALLNCLMDERLDAERPRRRPIFWAFYLVACLIALSVLFIYGVTAT